MNPPSLPQPKHNGLSRAKGLKRSAWGAEKAPRNQSSEWREVGKGRAWPAHWMSEKDFQSHCESVGAGHGWKTSHAHLPYFDTAGIPDLTAVCIVKGRERAIFRELKVRNRKGYYEEPKGAQSDWLAWMANAGLNVGVWVWPDDDDAIFAEFAR